MKLPKLTAPSSSTTFVEEFKGYNHNLRSDMVDSYGRMEFYDMQNMCLDDYPAISTRKGISQYGNINGIFSGIHNHSPQAGLLVIEGCLYVMRNGVKRPVNMTDVGTMSYDMKEFATTGVYTYIAPDGFVYDASTETDSQAGTIYKLNNPYKEYLVYYPESTIIDHGLKVQIVPCDINGTAISYVAQASAPSDTTKYWYDTTNKKWKKYSTTYTQWVEVESSYSRVKFMATGQNSETDPEYEDEDFDAYRAKLNTFVKRHLAFDTMSIKLYANPSQAASTSFTDMILYEVGVDSQTSGEAPWVVISTGDELYSSIWYCFTVEDRAPTLEHICSLNNRIWGISNTTHEIFASKQGAPYQWYNYAGLSSDSFALSTGLAEEMTCAVAYANYPTFFTENKLMKIYGSYPSAYQLYSVACDGVKNGASASAVTVEGTLYYVSPAGVMSYSGSTPQALTDKFEPYFFDGKTLVAGKDGLKYCLSTEEGEQVYEYHTQRAIWCGSENDVFVDTALYNNSLIYANKQNVLCTTNDHSLTKDTVDKYEDATGLFGDRENVYILDDERASCLYETVVWRSSTVDAWSVNPLNCRGHASTDSDGNNYVELYGTDHGTLFLGVGVPFRVSPGQVYILEYSPESNYDYICIAYFTTDGEGGEPLYFLGGPGTQEASDWVDGDDNNIIDGDGNALILNGKANSFKKYLLGEKITIPDGADTLYVVFGTTADEDAYMRYNKVRLMQYIETEETPIPWMLETGWQGLSTPYQKYFSRIQLRLDFCGSLMCQVKYAETDAWQTVLNIADPETDEDTFKSMTIPINVRRTDRIKIKLSGSGWVKLYSIGYTTQEGSERCLI